MGLLVLAQTGRNRAKRKGEPHSRKKISKSTILYAVEIRNPSLSSPGDDVCTGGV